MRGVERREPPPLPERGSSAPAAPLFLMVAVQDRPDAHADVGKLHERPGRFDRDISDAP